MARCKYCNKSAGLWRSMHPECRDRHDRAVALIPDFFRKLLKSDLPVDRFQDLLQKAAEASFVPPDEVASLVGIGLSKLIIGVLRRRLLSRNEIDRITQIIGAFNSALGNIDFSHETLVKAIILRDLQETKIPDMISITEDLPFKLEENEEIIWIFNHVTMFETSYGTHSDVGAGVALDKVEYYGLNKFRSFRLSQNDRECDKGDLIVTTDQFRWLSSDLELKTIPFATIHKVRACLNNIVIDQRAKEKATYVFTLNDPWFAANLIARLRSSLRAAQE